eukprot:6492328-Amphidinium_carterae.2
MSFKGKLLQKPALYDAHCPRKPGLRSKTARKHAWHSQTMIVDQRNHFKLHKPAHRAVKRLQQIPSAARYSE